MKNIKGYVVLRKMKESGAYMQESVQFSDIERELATNHIKISRTCEKEDEFVLATLCVM